MVRLDNRVSASPSIVEGFSARFNVFLDCARFPKENRIALGAKRFGAAYNTVKGWCSADKTPGSYSALVAIVEEILDEGPGLPNPNAVAAWLLAGDAVPNPFAEDTDALALVYLHFQISDIAKQQGIDFGTLSREVQSLILNHIRTLLPADAFNAAEGPQIDNTVLSALKVLLASTRTITG